MRKTKKSARAKRARKKNFATGSSSVPPLVGAFKMPEACQYIGGIHSATMRRLIERGLIVPNRKMRHLTFTIAELDRFLTEGVD
jgi:hypothetical protein